MKRKEERERAMAMLEARVADEIAEGAVHERFGEWGCAQAAYERIRPRYEVISAPTPGAQCSRDIVRFETGLLFREGMCAGRNGDARKAWTLIGRQLDAYGAATGFPAASVGEADLLVYGVDERYLLVATHLARAQYAAAHEEARPHLRRASELLGRGERRARAWKAFVPWLVERGQMWLASRLRACEDAQRHRTAELTLFHAAAGLAAAESWEEGGAADEALAAAAAVAADESADGAARAAAAGLLLMTGGKAAERTHELAGEGRLRGGRAFLAVWRAAVVLREDGDLEAAASLLERCPDATGAGEGQAGEKDDDDDKKEEEEEDESDSRHRHAPGQEDGDLDLLLHRTFFAPALCASDAAKPGAPRAKWFRPAVLAAAARLYGEILLRHGPTARAFWYRAGVWRALGRFRAAARDLRRAHELNPDFAADFFGCEADDARHHCDPRTGAWLQVNALEQLSREHDSGADQPLPGMTATTASMLAYYEDAMSLARFEGTEMRCKSRAESAASSRPQSSVAIGMVGVTGDDEKEADEATHAAAVAAAGLKDNGGSTQESLRLPRKSRAARRTMPAGDWKAAFQADMRRRAMMPDAKPSPPSRARCAASPVAMCSPTAMAKALAGVEEENEEEKEEHEGEEEREQVEQEDGEAEDNGKAAEEKEEVGERPKVSLSPARPDARMLSADEAEYWHLRAGRADANRLAGHHNKSEREFRRVLEFAPGSMLAAVGCVTVLARALRLDDAEQLCYAALARLATLEKRYTLARAEAAADPRMRLQRWALRRDRVLLLSFHSLVLQMRGETSAARRLLSNARSVDVVGGAAADERRLPRCPTALFVRFRLELRCGGLADAYASLEQLHWAEPTFPVGLDPTSAPMARLPPWMDDGLLARPEPPAAGRSAREWDVQGARALGFRLPKSSETSWRAPEWHRAGCEGLRVHGLEAVLHCFGRALEHDPSFRPPLHEALAAVEADPDSESLLELLGQASDSSISQTPLVVKELFERAKVFEEMDKQCEAAFSDYTLALSLLSLSERRQRELTTAKAAAADGKTTVAAAAATAAGDAAGGAGTESAVAAVAAASAQAGGGSGGRGDISWRRGLLFRRRGNLREAVADVGRALGDVLAQQADMAAGRSAAAQQYSKPMRETVLKILDKKVEVYTFARAELYLHLGEHGRALDDLSAVVRLNPLKAEAVKLRSLVCTRMGRLDDACADLVTYRGMRPADLAAAVRLAAVYLRRGQLNAAWEQASELSEEAPRNPQVLYLKGLVQMARGRPSAARRNLQTCLLVDSGHLPAMLRLGQVETLLGDYAEAEYTLQTLLHIQEANAACHRALGTARLARGRLSRALASVDRCLELLAEAAAEPRDGTAPEPLGGAMGDRSDLPGEQARANLLKGVCLYLRGDTANSLLALDQAVALGDGLAEALFFRAHVRAVSCAGRAAPTREAAMRSARADLEECLERDPSHHEARQALGSLRFAEGVGGEGGGDRAALELFEDVIEASRPQMHGGGGGGGGDEPLAPPTITELAHAYMNRGMLRMRAKRPSDACEDLGVAVCLALRARGLPRGHYAVTGKVPSGTVVTEGRGPAGPALPSKPLLSLPLLLRAECLRQMGDDADAARDFQAAIEGFLPGSALGGALPGTAAAAEAARTSATDALRRPKSVAANRKSAGALPKARGGDASAAAVEGAEVRPPPLSVLSGQALPPDGGGGGGGGSGGASGRRASSSSRRRRSASPHQRLSRPGSPGSRAAPAASSAAADPEIVSEDEYASIRNTVGVFLHGTGRVEEASLCFAMAAKSNGDHHAALYNRGVVDMLAGRYGDALSRMKRARKADPGHATTCVNSGWLSEQVGQVQEATESYLAAQRLNRSSALSCYNLGNVRFRQGKHAEAAGLYGYYLQHAPDSLFGLNNRAVCSALLQQTESARAGYAQALRSKSAAAGAAPALSSKVMPSAAESVPGVRLNKALLHVQVREPGLALQELCALQQIMAAETADGGGAGEQGRRRSSVAGGASGRARRGSVVHLAQPDRAASVARLLEYCKRWQRGLGVACRDVWSGLRALPLPLRPRPLHPRCAQAGEGDLAAHAHASSGSRSIDTATEDDEGLAWFNPARLADPESDEFLLVEDVIEHVAPDDPDAAGSSAKDIRFCEALEEALAQQTAGDQELAFSTLVRATYLAPAAPSGPWPGGPGGRVADADEAFARERAAGGAAAGGGGEASGRAAVRGAGHALAAAVGPSRRTAPAVPALQVVALWRAQIQVSRLDYLGAVQSLTLALPADRAEMRAVMEGEGGERRGAAAGVGVGGGGRAEPRAEPLSESERRVYAAILNRIGTLQLRSGAMQDAETSFARALKLEPGNVCALLNRGCLYRAQARYSKSIDDLFAVLCLLERQKYAMRHGADEHAPGDRDCRVVGRLGALSASEHDLVAQLQEYCRRVQTPPGGGWSDTHEIQGAVAISVEKANAERPIRATLAKEQMRAGRLRRNRQEASTRAGPLPAASSYNPAGVDAAGESGGGDDDDNDIGSDSNDGESGGASAFEFGATRRFSNSAVAPAEHRKRLDTEIGDAMGGLEALLSRAQAAARRE